ncbi:lipid A deacylase LpxR family protein [Acidobacteriota bacterium]
MKKAALLLLILAGLLLTTSIALAEKQKDFGIFTIRLENDTFAGTDRDYTHGARLTWVSPYLSTDKEDSAIPGWIYSLIEKLSIFNNPEAQQAVSLSIGHNIYTPYDIERFDLIKEDRPYAGITYIGIGFYSKNKRHMDSLKFDFGIVGPHSFAEGIQKFIHELYGGTLPNGWKNQLKDEFAIGLSYNHTWKWLQSENYGDFGYALIPHVGGSLGNIFTGIYAGAEVRMGWNLPDNFGTSNNHPASEGNFASAEYASNTFRRQRFGFHFFASVEGEAVFQNIFLDGNTFQDSHHVEKLPFSVDITAGISMTLGRFIISCAYVLRTKQFKTQQKEHIFGTINLAYPLFQR